MTPNEIGAAAAYEVWRNWRYNYGVLAQPLGGDIPRQREALIGLAVGEGQYLLFCINIFSNFRIPSCETMAIYHTND